MIASCPECNHQFDPGSAELLGIGRKWLRYIRKPLRVKCPNCYCFLKFQAHPTFAKVDKVVFVLLMTIFIVAIILHYIYGSIRITTILYLIFVGISLIMSLFRSHFSEKGRYIRA